MPDGSSPRILWQPQPGPQASFIKCPVDEVLYGGARGGGKLSPVDSKILTPFGWKHLGDIKPGDAVCATDGTVTKVIAIFPQGKVQNYRVKFHDGTSLECGLDHNWFGWRVNKMVKIGNERVCGERAAQVWTTREIMEWMAGESDRKHYATRRFAIPVCEPCAFNGTFGRQVGQFIDPYLLGLLIGDGCLRGCSPDITSADEEILFYCVDQAGGDATVHRWRDKTPHVRFNGPYGAWLRGALQHHKLWGCRSEAKRIPRRYLFAPVDIRWGLFQGLMDSDGWAETDRALYYTTVSEGLAEDVAHLARSLGAIVTRTVKTPTYDGGAKQGLLAYNLRIKIRAGERCFRLQRKRVIAETIQPQCMARFVESVEPTRVVESICIQVRHPNSLYIADDFIVTHNTDASLGDWIIHQERYGEHARGLFLRRNRTEFENLLERCNTLFTPMRAKWNGQKSRWVFPKGGSLTFQYLERDSDANLYQGHQYTRLYIEELSLFPDQAPINKMRATLRSAHGVPCRMRATTNPGGPGHLWVKHRYVDPAPRGFKVLTETYTDPFTGEERVWTRVFIPAKVADNRILLQSDPGYVARLQQVGSENLVRMWLHGDWDVIEGAYFDCWDASKHVVPYRTLPAHWTRIEGFDWGSQSPFSVVWGAVSDGELDEFPPGALVIYREWYGASGPNTGLKMENPEIARGIIKRRGDDNIRLGAADPSIWKRDGGPAIWEQMDEATGFKLRWIRADNQRIAGWQQVRSRLVGQDGRPMLYIMDNCTDLIRTLPALQHDEHKPEDVDTDGEDHAADALRYLCMSRPWQAPIPAEARSIEEIMEESRPTFNDLKRGNLRAKRKRR